MAAGHKLDYGYADHVFSPPTGDPNKIGRWLDRLRRTHGKLTAELVLAEAAKHPHSEAHHWFTWDNDQAAAERRLEQAQYLIRSVKIIRVDNEPVPPVRANIRRVVTDDGMAETVYEDALDPEVRALQRHALQQQLFRLRSKLAAFEEFGRLVEEIDRLAAAVKDAA